MTDLALTRYEQPWRDITLALIERFSEQQYKRKEELRERLVKLLEKA